MAEWDAVAVKEFAYKSLADLLKHRYHTLKESTPTMASWFTMNGFPLSALRIRQLMRKLKIKRRAGDAPHYPAAFWKGVDWKKSNQLIADEKNVDPATVRRWRERLGKDETRVVPRG